MRAHRNQISIMGHDIIRFLDLQEQTSGIAPTGDCMGT
jgi:hypothetical protein